MDLQSLIIAQSLCALGILVGSVWLIFVAFSVSTGWGVLILVDFFCCGLLRLIFAITHWDAARWGGLIYILSILTSVGMFATNIDKIPAFLEKTNLTKFTIPSGKKEAPGEEPSDSTNPASMSPAGQAAPSPGAPASAEEVKARLINLKALETNLRAKMKDPSAVEALKRDIAAYNQELKLVRESAVRFNVRLDQGANPPTDTSKGVKGIIGGKAYRVDSAKMQGDTLTFKEVGNGIQREVSVFLFEDDENSVQGKVYVATPGDPLNPYVNVTFKNGKSEPKVKTFTENYSMRLAFGKAKGGSIPLEVAMELPDGEETHTLEGSTVVKLSKK